MMSNAFNPQSVFNPTNKLQATIPNDRTPKQPVYCFCANPECLDQSSHSRFVFPHEHGLVECPKCGANEAPYVGVLALIHYMARLPRGPIRGVGGIGFHIACDPKRAYLATATNQEAATDQIEAVTCPGCLAAYEANKVDRGGSNKQVLKMGDPSPVAKLNT